MRGIAYATGLMFFLCVAIVGAQSVERGFDHGVLDYSYDNRFASLLLISPEDYSDKFLYLWTCSAVAPSNQEAQVRLRDCLILSRSGGWPNVRWGHVRDNFTVNVGCGAHYQLVYLCIAERRGENAVRVRIRDLTPYLLDDYLRRHPARSPDSLTVIFSAVGFTADDSKVVITCHSYSKSPSDSQDYAVFYDPRNREVTDCPASEVNDLRSRPGSGRKGPFVVHDPLPIVPAGSRKVRRLKEYIESYRRNFSILVEGVAPWTTASLLVLENRGRAKYPDFDYVIENEPTPLLVADRAHVQWTWGARRDVFGICLGGRSDEARLLHGAVHRDPNGAVDVSVTELSPVFRSMIQKTFGETMVACTESEFEENDRSFRVRCIAGGGNHAVSFSAKCDVLTDAISIQQQNDALSK